MKNQRGITLISLVITIIILIILAGVAINMTLGENGIFTKAQEAKKAQTIAEIKEQIGLEILETQIEATERNEEVEQTKIEEIVSKYGELQEDGDTIILKDNGYEISLKEIYNGIIGSSEDGTGNTELDNLKIELAKTNATSEHILKDYKAYSNGKLLAGTMENYAGTTQDGIVTNDDNYIYLAVPNSGYYTTESKLRMERNNSKNYLIEDGVTRNNFSYTTTGTVSEVENGLLVIGSIEFSIDVSNIKNIYFVLGATSHYNNTTPYYPYIYLNDTVANGDPSCIDVSDLTGNARIKINAWGGDAFSFTIFEIYTK